MINIRKKPCFQEILLICRNQGILAEWIHCSRVLKKTVYIKEIAANEEIREGGRGGD